MNIPKIKKPGRKPNNLELMIKIDALKVDHMLTIHKFDWKLKTAPKSVTISKRIGKKFSVYCLADDTGWIIRRNHQ